MRPPSPTEWVKVDPTEKTPCNEKKPKKQQHQQQQKQETKNKVRTSLRKNNNKTLKHQKRRQPHLCPRNQASLLLEIVW